MGRSHAKNSLNTAYKYEMGRRAGGDTSRNRRRHPEQFGIMRKRPQGAPEKLFAVPLPNCSRCGQPAAIYTQYDREKSVYRVWAQCTGCGHSTRVFVDLTQPTADSTGTRFAKMAWNAQAGRG